MKLSPLDIKKQEFKRTMRGYDIEEIQAFLDMLAGQWEELLAEHRRAEDRLRELKGKLEHYQRVEEALQEALQTARESSKQTLENAKQEAALIVKKAVGEADDLTRSAMRQRDLLLQEIDHLNGRRDEVVAKLRAFLLSEVEILERFDEREWAAATRPKAAEPDPGPTMTTGAGLPEAPVPVVPGEEETRQPPAPDAAEAAAEPADAPAAAAPVLDEALPAMAGLDAAPEDVADVSAGLDTAPPHAEALIADGPHEHEEAPAGQAPPAEAPQEEAEPMPETFSVEILGAGLSVKDRPGRAKRAGMPPAPREAAPPEPDAPFFYVEEEPLSFRFFEPHEERDVEKFYQDEATREKVRFGSSADRALKGEQPPADDTWIVRPVVPSPKGAADEHAAQEGLTASSEEIEKIRRILNDLD